MRRYSSVKWIIGLTLCLGPAAGSFGQTVQYTIKGKFG
jgi:hypothetical protein